MLQRCSIIVGSQAIKRSLKPGSSFDGESLSSSRSTQASRTGKFAQMFGPRNDRIFRIFMPLRSVLYTVEWRPKNAAGNAGCSRPNPTLVLDYARSGREV